MSDHACGVITNCAQILYALSVLRVHGMCYSADHLFSLLVWPGTNIAILIPCMAYMVQLVHYKLIRADSSLRRPFESSVHSAASAARRGFSNARSRSFFGSGYNGTVRLSIRRIEIALNRISLLSCVL